MNEDQRVKSQQAEMLRRVWEIILHFSLAIASLMLIFVIEWIIEDSLYDRVIKPGLSLTIGSTILWGIVLFTSRSIKRAFVFHLSLAMISLMFSAVPFVTMMLLAILYFRDIAWLISIFLSVALLLFFSRSYLKYIRMLSTYEDVMMTRGRLDKENGKWDLTIYLDSPKIDQPRKEYQWLILALGGMILMVYLYRIKRSNNPSIMLIILLAIQGGMLDGVGVHLAFAAQLLSWEKEINKKILLTIDDDIPQG